MMAKLWKSSAQDVCGNSSWARTGPVGPCGPWSGRAVRIQTFAFAAYVGSTNRVAISPKMPPRMASPMVSHLYRAIALSMRCIWGVPSEESSGGSGAQGAGRGTWPPVSGPAGDATTG